MMSDCYTEECYVYEEYIVDELGHIVMSTDDVSPMDVVMILRTHPEWNQKCIPVAYAYEDLYY